MNDRFRLMARAGQATKTPILAEVTAPKLTDGVATLRLYDVIDSWGGPYGISAKEFAEVLDDLPDDTTEIRLHISSPGGEVWDGLAILNSLRQHRARVVTIVDGIAASAASVVAMAGDEVLMAPGSELMIHAAWGLCVGNATDMAKLAETLQHESDNLAGIYAAKAGGTVEEWRAAMSAETWYTADEAVAAGLADRVLLPSKLAADATADGMKARARFDLSVFAYAGRAKAPAPHTPTASAAGSTQQKGSPVVYFTDEQLTTLRQQVGVAPDADEGTILAALTEALAERSESQPEPVPAGHVVVPEARLRDLEAGVALSAQVATRMQEQERAAFLDSNRAKYAPANRAAWETEYDRDPAGTKAHFAKAPEIIALTPIGHDGDADLTADDALYASLYGTTAKTGV